MHVFPQLRKLEEKYAGELAVVGVHSAKFNAEKATDGVRRAILRYEIEHPVINDADFMVWQQYACRAWPTLMFISPTGKVIGKHEGEFPIEALDNVLAEMIGEFDEQGEMDRKPLAFRLESELEWERPLSFPGKVLASEHGLFISDSNHNRIVWTDLEGEIRAIIGSGERGLKDGSASQAAFYDPQGAALDWPRLYVADTKNHAIRMIDLETLEVRTLAGTGEQSVGRHAGGNGRFVPLASPWDVVKVQNTLYIAMAGFHQLWKLDLNTRDVRPHAGNGRERIIDGPLQHAELAQPSGIVSDGETLYFADSETSSIRSAAVSPMGSVNTLVGEGLFTFGDVDGIGDDVRLQHPIGVDLYDGMLWLTDSYNNKIKSLDPSSRLCRSVFGSGNVGNSDGAADAAEFYEPGGVSAYDGKLYIADTNNHAIRVADLESREVMTLQVRGD